MAPPDGGGTGRHPIRVGRGLAPAGFPSPARSGGRSRFPPADPAARQGCRALRDGGAGPPPKPSEAGSVGKRSRSGRNELCRLRQSERSGACGDAVTLRVGRMAGELSPGSAKNAAPGCARRLFFRLRPVLAPLCAYPPRFSLSRSACSRRPASLRLRAQTASLRTGLVCTRRSGPSGLLTTAPRFSFGNFHKSFSETY